jgi:hypothetical protein
MVMSERYPYSGRKYSRRSAFQKWYKAGALVAAGGITWGTYNQIDNRLSLEYKKSPIKVKEGSPFSLNFSPKLEVQFLPLEHLPHNKNLKKFGNVIQQTLLQDGIDEVWMESYPEEMRNLTKGIPPGLRTLVDVGMFFTQRDRLINFFGQIEDVVSARPNLGRKPVDIVCPDIVGGSPLVALISAKPVVSLHFWSYILAAGAVFPMLDVLENSTEYVADPIDRRDFVTNAGKLALSPAALGTIASYEKTNLHHQAQIHTNRPKNYVTDDTFRESWLLWTLRKYSENLEQDPSQEKKKIVFIHTPPHIEAMMKRLTNPDEHKREMKMYFNITPPQIWREGIRKYSPDTNGEYKKVPFQLYL